MDFVYLRALGQILKMSYHFIPKLSTGTVCLSRRGEPPGTGANETDSKLSPDSYLPISYLWGRARTKITTRKTAVKEIVPGFSI